MDGSVLPAAGISAFKSCQHKEMVMKTCHTSHRAHKVTGVDSNSGWVDLQFARCIIYLRKLAFDSSNSSLNYQSLLKIQNAMIDESAPLVDT